MTHDEITTLPKIDLHAHMNGSIPVADVKGIVAAHQVPVPSGFNMDEDLTVTTPVEGFTRYFRPWALLKRLPATSACLDAIVHAVARSLAEDGVYYAEMRYSPSSIVQAAGVELSEALDWLASAVRIANSSTGVNVRLLISVGRDEISSGYCDKLLAAFGDANASDVIVGVDLTGDETLPLDRAVAARFFRGAWAKHGLPCSIHAGETGNADEIWWAINSCEARRIGHGLGAVRDQNLLERLHELGVCVEVCMTSNRITGFVPNVARHPVRMMLNHGVHVALCTDNPAIHGSTLSQELSIFLDSVGTVPELHDILARAQLAAFDRKAAADATTVLRQLQ